MSFTVSGYNNISVGGAIHVYQSNGTTDVGVYPTTNPSATVNTNGTWCYSVIINMWYDLSISR
jgi:hypothetical protein